MQEVRNSRVSPAVSPSDEEQEASGSMQEKFVAHVGQALPKLRESLEVTDWLSFRDTFRDLDDNLVNSVLQEHTIPLINRLALIKMLKTLGSEDGPAFQGAAKMDELGDEIEHLRECEEQLENWRQFSGMHSMLEDFRKKGDTSHDINDISIGLMRGVEETMDQTVAGIQESGVVAALLLSFSIPLLVDPPDAIGDLDDWAWQKVMHLLGWGIMSGKMCWRVNRVSLTRESESDVCSICLQPWALQSFSMAKSTRQLLVAQSGQRTSCG